ncbi:MAG: PAS domain S-box protein [Planctomycetaceae bacterium]|nr:PAS domain S-box protein [Planctomycetaceae bacterium]
MWNWAKQLMTQIGLNGKAQTIQSHQSNTRPHSREPSAAEQQFHATIECSPTAILMINHQGTIVLVNEETERLFGYTREELLGESVDMLVPQRFRQRHTQYRADYFLSPEARRMGSGRELFGLRKDGSEVPVEIGLRTIHSNGETYALSVVVDISARLDSRIELEAALEREQIRTRQLQQLADAAIAITGHRPVQEILVDVSERARTLIGAHQAITRFTIDPQSGMQVTGVSLSDTYAKYRDYNVPADGSGIYRLVCESNRPMRMTQEELEAHPDWKGFGAQAAYHPPMRGWLAAPLIAQNGDNLGLIQLTDRFFGEFTAEDEAILVQLAQMTSSALEVRTVQTNLEIRIMERTAELQTSRERMDLALRSASVGTWAWNVSKNVVTWDDHMYPLFGRPLGTFGGTYESFEEMLVPGEADKVRETIERALEFGREYDAEFRVLWPDTSVHTIAARGKVYKNSSGELVRMTGVCWDVTERSRGEAIRRALFDQSVNFIGLLSTDGRIVDANRTALAAARVSADDVLGKPFWETPWWSHSVKLQERLKQAIRTVAKGTPDGFEATHVDPDGEQIVVQFSLKPVRDTSGNVIYLIPEGQNITEHKRRDAQLKQLLAELGEVASRLALSERGEELKGQKYRLDEFTLTSMMDCGAVIRGLSDCSTKQQFTDDLVRFLHNQVIDEEGNSAFSLAQLFETVPFAELSPTQQKVALALETDISAETPCLTLVASAGSAVSHSDGSSLSQQYVIPLPNSEALREHPLVGQLVQQLGIDVGRVPDMNSDLPLSDDGTDVLHIENADLSGPVAIQKDFAGYGDVKSVIGFGDTLPDGRLFAVILFARVPVPPETASLFGHLSQSARMAYLAHVDVPNRTEAQIVSIDRLLRSHERIVAQQEDRLRLTLGKLAASNAELEQFAYVASHDLQEPLRKIQSFGDLLVAGFQDKLGEEGQDYLKRMHRSAERMQVLIDDLLALSRVLRRGQAFEPVDLNDTVKSVLSDLETRISTSQGRVIVEELPSIEADPTQMRQLLQNLIGNALKYCRPEEPPVVRVTSRVIECDEGNGRAAEPYCELTVSDNGIGFDSQYAQRIFQPFQRLHGHSRYEGTGIGLTICRRITDRHRGTIEAHGELGKGSQFVVRLPLHQVNEE